MHIYIEVENTPPEDHVALQARVYELQSLPIISWLSRLSEALLAEGSPRGVCEGGDAETLLDAELLRCVRTERFQALPEDACLFFFSSR